MCAETHHISRSVVVPHCCMVGHKDHTMDSHGEGISKAAINSTKRLLGEEMGKIDTFSPPIVQEHLASKKSSDKENKTVGLRPILQEASWSKRAHTLQRKDSLHIQDPKLLHPLINPT